jgi:transcriptional regulator with XRE-family HTH domain
MPLPTPAARRILAARKEFSVNLRVLCSYYRSVADVCRKLNINRAQFNRYLNGTSQPSSHTLERICDFFGVEVAEIYLQREQFLQIVQVRPRPRIEHTPYGEHVARLQFKSNGQGDKYLGYYYEYYRSMSASGKVLRGLVHIFMHEGATYHERLERFPRHPNFDETYKCKYVGATFFLNDRIFLVDYESMGSNEIAQTVLYGTCKNRVARLSGLMLGVSSSNQRSIACARTVFEFLGKDIDVRKAMRLCGLFDPEAGTIDPNILKVINNLPQQDQQHFCTLPL